MILEATLEQSIIDALKQLPELAESQFIGSRLQTKEEDACNSIIAVATGIRQHDNFSLTPISVPIAITIVTRAEEDNDSSKHNAALEAIINQISLWHKYGNIMQQALSNDNFLAGELKSEGGPMQKYDKSNYIWTDMITITIRGAEKFNI